MRRAVAATLAAAAVVGVTAGAAVATDAAQLGRDHQAARARASIISTHVPDLEGELLEVVDTAYAARLSALASLEPASTADVGDADPVTDDQIAAALAAAVVAGQVDTVATTSTAALNLHGLPDADAVAAAAPAAPVLPPTVTGAGGLICPVVGHARFINDWGYPRSGGRTHQGTDLFAPTGTPLVAVADGTISALTPVDLYRPGVQRHLGGISLSIVDAAGVRWYYAHLDQLVDGLAVGQPVTAGQQLGTVGTSGNARTTPPHLHLGRYEQGRATNPWPHLNAIC